MIMVQRRLPLQSSRQTANRLELKRPEFRRNVLNLFDRLEHDEVYRQQFVRDPTGHILEDVYRKPFARQRISDANRLLFSLVANHRFHEWVTGYVRKHRGVRVDRDKVSRDFAHAIAEFGDPVIVQSLALAAASGLLGASGDVKFAHQYSWAVSEGCVIYNHSYAWTENEIKANANAQSDSQSDSQSDTTSDSHADTTSDSHADTTSDSQADTTSDSQSASQSDSQSDSSSASQSDSSSDSQSASASDSQSDSNSETSSEGKLAWGTDLVMSAATARLVTEQLLDVARNLAANGSLQNTTMLIR
jgi:hypothetical protein